MKLRILLTVFAFSVFTAGIQGATPDLKKSSKTELTEKVAISPLSDISFQVVNYDNLSDVVISTEAENIQPVISPTKGVSKFVKHINSKAKKERKNKRDRTPRDNVSESKQFLSKLKW